MPLVKLREVVYNFSSNTNTYRGVAQLIARSVWDREVEGLSPFTPTKKKSVQMDRFFLYKRYC